MAPFGGKSQFGGLTKFGGGENRWLILYRILKSIAPPGLWPQDDDTLINHTLRVDAKAHAVGLVHVEAVFREMYPHTASETLLEWSEFLGVDLPTHLGVLLEEQRAPIVSKWRGAKNTALKNLRDMFCDLINPTRARVDGFDSGAISARFNDEPGNGTTTEAAGVLDIATLAADCTWDGSTLSPTVPRVFERLPDIDDDWTFDAEIDQVSQANDTAMGMFVEQDAQNVTMFVFNDAGGTERKQIDQILEGALAEDVDSMAVALPALPRLMRIQKSGTELIFLDAAVGGTPVEFHRVDVKHKTRRIGWFVRNETGTLNVANMTVDDYELTMGQTCNNVDIIETPKAVADLAGDASLVFTGAINRRPSDTGSGDLDNATRLADKVKQGHTLLRVIESEVFLTDDQFSLTDRDLLGV